MTDDQNPSQTTGATSDFRRRSYLRALGALGVGAGFAGESAAAATQDSAGQPNDRGLTIADSGNVVTRNATRVDFDDGLSAVEGDDSGDVRVDADATSDPDSTNPNVVDVREDLGVEPEGDDVWGAIYDHYSSFTDPNDRCHRYVIPCGTWYVATDEIELDEHRYFGVVGEPFAVLEVTSPDVDLLMRVGTVDDSLPHAQRTVMENLRVDIRGDYDAGIGRWYTYRDGYVENVELRGQRDRRNPDYGGDRHTLKIDGIRPEATNVVRNVRLNHGDTYYDTDSGVGHAIPFSSESPHEGTNVWECCQVTGFFDNGLYVSGGPGRNILVGCRAHNNAGANIRIGNDDMVLNSEIVMDVDPGHPWSGLWVEDDGGQVVDGLQCRNSITKTSEIVRCTQAGPARLANVHVEDEGGDGRAIRVADDGNPTVFENCTLVDRTTADASGYAVYVRSSNVVFRGCQFDLASQSDANRNGIVVFGAGDSAVDRVSLEACEVNADVASLRFASDGRDHSVDRTVFRALVTSDADTTLSNVLWTGNRHYGGTSFDGTRSNWKGDFNWEFDV